MNNNLNGKKIIVGVTGGIAAYKACEIVSRLVSYGAEVKVIQTQSSLEFVSKLTFFNLSKNPVYVDVFSDVNEKEFNVKHIELARWADLFVVVPATANVIAKFAYGIADDALSTTYLACTSKKIICPAMNTNMWENENTQENVRKLANMGVAFIGPASGRLACNTTGIGRLENVEVIINEIVNELTIKRDLEGRKVLVTLGGTKEAIDPVRFITNSSSGKMGYEIGMAAKSRGAQVCLICGNISINIPSIFDEICKVESTEEMYDAVKDRFEETDTFIFAAAPADYKPKEFSKNKIKDKELTISFVKNVDIAASIGKIKGYKETVVFSAETENLIKNAKEKLKNKNADFVVANDVTVEGAGFGTDTNIITIIDRDGKVYEYPKLKKREVANIILDRLVH